MEETQRAQLRLQEAFRNADGLHHIDFASSFIKNICAYFHSARSLYPSPLNPSDELKQRRFKPLQKAAYMCMAKCCDSDESQEALQQCFAQCNKPVVRVHPLAPNIPTNPHTYVCHENG
jgi:hypothetical protein